jgi:hypothetical protein
MKTYAVVDKNRVTNLILALTKKDAEIAGSVVEIDPYAGILIGWEYNPADNSFSAPEPEPEPEPEAEV